MLTVTGYSRSTSMPPTSPELNVLTFGTSVMTTSTAPPAGQLVIPGSVVDVDVDGVAVVLVVLLVVANTVDVVVLVVDGAAVLVVLLVVAATLVLVVLLVVAMVELVLLVVGAAVDVVVLVVDRAVVLVVLVVVTTVELVLLVVGAAVDVVVLVVDGPDVVLLWRVVEVVLVVETSEVDDEGDEVDVVVDPEASPTSVMRATAAEPTTKRPVNVAPLVTRSAASSAQTLAATCAARETSKRIPSAKIRSAPASWVPVDAKLAFGPMRRSPATRRSVALVASRTAPRRRRTPQKA